MGREYNKDARQKELLALLEQNDFVSSERLVERFQCSLSTVRNDLVELEQKGLLIRSLGGARGTAPKGSLPVSSRMSEHSDAKRSIAKFAVENYVKDKSTVILDAGTTSLEIAYAIAASNMEVSVLTSSLLVSHALADVPQVQLYTFGGLYNKESAYFYDEFIQDRAKYFYADTYFMGVNGVDPNSGFTIAFRDEAMIKQTWMSIASRTIAVCDSTKAMRSAYRVMAKFDQVNTLITDDGIAPNAVELLEQKGLTVQIAKPEHRA